MALVPAFLGLRRPAFAPPQKPFRAPRDPDLASTDVRPPEPPRAAAAPEALRAETPGEPGPEAEAVEPPVPAPQTASRPDAREAVAAAQMAKPRRRSGLGRHPEQIAAHRKLSDHVGLWEICRARVCRRARACAGPEAVACLYDHRAVLQPIIPELLGALRRAHPED